MPAVLQVRERPVLFSGEMVRAILDGRKTQTRRVVKPQPVKRVEGEWGEDGEISLREDLFWTTPAGGLCLCEQVSRGHLHYMGVEQFVREFCPYGQPGDRLWVRERFAMEDGAEPRVVYAADRAARYVAHTGQPASDLFWLPSDYAPARWRPSIHMPRWASRITMELTDVRVERVQEISVEDCCAEGVRYQSRVDGTPAGYCVPDLFAAPAGHFTPRICFWRTWDSLNAKRGHGWDVNPWVWVLEFRRCES